MTAQDQKATEAGSPNLTLLKWIVVGLGILIVIGLVVVVVTVANRMGGRAAPAADPVALPAAFGRAEIQAGPRTEIRAASAGGGVILLTLRAPGTADIVVVLDAVTGQERGRLQLSREPAADEGAPDGGSGDGGSGGAAQ